MKPFVICIRENGCVFAGQLAVVDYGQNGLLFVTLTNAVNLTGDEDLPDPLYATREGPTELSFTEVIPRLVLTCVATVMQCTEKANGEWRRATGCA